METTKSTKIMKWTLTCVIVLVLSLGVLSGVTSLGGDEDYTEEYSETYNTNSSPF
ncbi:hypothetical protein VPHK406_0204 [Vibrio phage K406]